MPSKQTTELETLILCLLDEAQEVSIRSVARAAGFSENDDTKRKAIQRALNSLEKRAFVSSKGAGRARGYIGSEALANPSAFLFLRD